MEYYSPVYELAHKCELAGMKSPDTWGLLKEEYLKEICEKWLRDKHDKNR